MDNDSVFIKMALHAWNVNLNRTGDFFNSFSDEELSKEIAPGKNSIAYLMGHLIAVNDNMIALFGLGNRSYAHLDETYVRNPDKSELEIQSPGELRAAWKASNAELSAYFEKMSSADWFSKHTAMTEEDLIKDPARNKLSVLLNRTNHLSYHLGQLILARKPSAE